MATVSSMLDLQDGFTKTIDNAINAMNRLTSSIDVLNRSVSMPKMDKPFSEIHNEAGAADTSVEQLTSSVDRLVRGMENLQMSSRMDNVDREFGEVRQEVTHTNEQLDILNNNLRMTGTQTRSVTAVASGFGGLSKAILVANNGIQLIQTAIQGINRLGSQADTRIGVDARLSLINDGLQTQAQLENKVMAASNATRTSYAATAALVASMGRQDYFKGKNDEAIQFASTVNKGLVVSGASATEAAGAITQLTQGLASGVLRGDEFNSIMENAPILAEMMTKSMGITKGQLRSMAENGKLTTDVVVSSIMAQSSTLDQQFAKMPMTFSQAKTVMGNDISQMMDYLSQPGHAIDIIIEKIEEMTAYLNTPQGTALMNNISAALTTAANLLSGFLSIAINTYQFFADNWSWIGPIILGVAAAIGIAAAANLIYNAVTAIGQGIELAGAAAKAAMTGATLAKTDATAAETAAQWGLNQAMLASPVTWVIAAIILLIVAIFAVVGAINKVTGSSISAIGVICGGINWVIQLFKNAGLWVADVAIGIWNALKACCSNIGTAFHNVIANVQGWFYNLLATALTVVSGICEGLNKLPFVNFDYSGISSKAKEYADKSAAAYDSKQDYADVSDAFNEGFNTFGTFSSGWSSDAYNSGYKFGQGIDNKVGGLMNSVTGLSDKLTNLTKQSNSAANQQNFGNAYSGLTPGSASSKNKLNGGKLDKVDKIGSSVDISDQSLEYLNDIAAEAALNRFDSFQTLTYEQADELQLSKKDADALRTSANSGTNIYYLNYSGGKVGIQNTINKGENWDKIKAQILDETESEIDAGLSGIDEVVSG